MRIGADMSIDNISENEMLALFPERASMDAWQQTKRRILYRTLLIVAAIAARLFLISFYPELHLQSVFEVKVIDREAVSSLVIARSLLLSVMGLVVCSALMWGDLQIFLLAELPGITMISIGFFALRIWVLYLLLQNYLDYRR